MNEEELTSIRNLIKARDDARRRRKYEVSDTIRDELKHVHGVFIDDRLKMWWTSVDGSKVPQSIHDIKGEGRWKLLFAPDGRTPGSANELYDLVADPAERHTLRRDEPDRVASMAVKAAELIVGE